MINSSQLLFLANSMEACSLDGVPAVLEPGHRGALARVRDRAGRNACFNWSVARHVILRCGGRFVTRQASEQAPPATHSLRLLAAA